MIRVYLDWNVISNLKRIEIPKFRDLRLHILQNLDRLLIPFTTAHINDLRKSIKPDLSNDLLLNDLELLSEISNNQFINWTKNNITEPFIGHPNRFYYENIEIWNNPNYFDFSNIFNDIIKSFEDIGLGAIGELYKNQMQSIPIDDILKNDAFKNMLKIDTDFNNYWDFLNVMAKSLQELNSNKEYYKEFRLYIQNSGLNVSENSEDWQDNEIFDNIDKLLKAKGVNQSFMELLTYPNQQVKKEKSTLYDNFISTYLMLDVIGYKSDKLKKPSNNMTNITNDAIHSFYGAHCEYLVTDDKNLLKKSKAIYSKLNKPTQIMSSDEFYNNFDKIVQKKYIHISDFLSQLSDFIKPENLIEQIEQEDGTVVNAFKLPYLVYDFFNYVVTNYLKEFDITELLFKKAFQTYSRFVFENELNAFIVYFFKTIGIAKEDINMTEIKSLIYEKEEALLVFNYEFIHIFLKKDEYKLSMVLYYNHKKANEIINK